jgi:hypothetical protein
MKWTPQGAGASTRWCAPHPWARTGPGLALDGKPKFDLKQLDPAYFSRLRSRVVAAGQRGIYVSVMLFEGYGMQFEADGWRGHPFHPDNNIGLGNADTNGDGKGLEIFTLSNPAVTAVQEAYVRQVVDTLNDLDNVLYEISNENHRDSTQWQYHFIRFVQRYESGKPKQHPVGMTFQYDGGKNANLFASPADWISPNPDAGKFTYDTNPPPADGRKVVLTDTDHLWGIGGDAAWVWKSFLRGLNPIFMDPYDNRVLGKAAPATWDPLRASLGHTRRLAERVDLATLVPRPELASTRYCLAQPGAEYLVYLPDGGDVTVDLSASPGKLAVAWCDPATGTHTAHGEVEGGASRTFKAPFAGHAVLHLSGRVVNSKPAAQP